MKRVSTCVQLKCIVSPEVSPARSFVLRGATQTNVVETHDPHLKVDLYDNQYI